jgi:hypothetical protein
MSPFETPAGLRAAFDTLLASTHRQLRLYDHDLHLYDLDAIARHTVLRAFCAAGGGRSIELLLDDTGRIARDHPRLMQLVRDFGHVLAVRQADPDATRPGHAFVVGDRHGVLLRADKSAVHGSYHADDPARAAPLLEEFGDMWQRAPAQLSATALGL